MVSSVSDDPYTVCPPAQDEVKWSMPSARTPAKLQGSCAICGSDIVHLRSAELAPGIHLPTSLLAQAQQSFCASHHPRTHAKFCASNEIEFVAASAWRSRLSSSG